MIIKYISDEIRKKYEGTIKKEKKKGSCPDCELKELNKFNVEIVNKDGEEIIKETK